jgi:hypothetical protein
MKQSSSILGLTALCLGIASQAWGIVASVPVLEPSGSRIAVRNVSELVAAIGSAAKGQTIMLADGTYDLSAVEPLRLRKDGVALYGASRDPAKVVFKGQGFGSGNVDEEMIKIEASDITLAYLTLRDVRANGLKLQTGANNGILVHNVDFIDICERSIKGPDIAVSLNGIVRYCLFEQTTPITASIPNLRFDGDYIAGMDMMKIQGWKIHNNVFKNIRGKNGGGRAGVFLWNGCKNVVVEQNTFIGCDRSISFGNPSSLAVDVDGGTIRNNFIVAGKDISLEVCNSKGTLIAFNTVYSTVPSFNRTLSFYQASASTLKNNLVLGHLSVQGGTVPDTAENLLLPAAGQSATWFRDIASGDLHLTPAALPAINKGLPTQGIETDIDNGRRDTKPDIGADELDVGIGIRVPLSPGVRPKGESGSLWSPGHPAPSLSWESARFGADGRFRLDG